MTASLIQLILLSFAFIFKSSIIFLISGFLQVLIDLLILKEDRGYWLPAIIFKIVFGILAGFLIQDWLSINQFPAMMGGYASASVIIEILLFIIMIFKAGNK